MDEGKNPKIFRESEKNNVDFLIGCLEHPDLKTRVAAVEALSRSGRLRARLPLKEILHDRWGQNLEVRRAALRCLSEMLEEEESRQLLENFACGDSPKLGIEARRLLKKRDPEGYATRLSRRGCVDTWSVKAYGSEREGGAVSLLVGLLNDRVESGSLTSAREWGRVHAAISSLGMIGDSEARETLEKVHRVLSEESEGDSLRKKRRERLLRAIEVSMDHLDNG